MILELTVIASVLITVVSVILLSALEKHVTKPDKIICFATGCGCSESAKLRNCPMCGKWYCPVHANENRPRFCSMCVPHAINYLRLGVSVESRSDLKNYSIQLSGISFAALAIIFSISPSTPNGVLVASFSVAIFLLLLTYVMVNYFESYGSFIIEHFLFLIGIEVLVIGAIDLAYPILVEVSLFGIGVGPALIGIGISAGLMLSILTIMEIRGIFGEFQGK